MYRFLCVGYNDACTINATCIIAYSNVYVGIATSTCIFVLAKWCTHELLKKKLIS